jgi:hypothetical protein
MEPGYYQDALVRYYTSFEVYDCRGVERDRDDINKTNAIVQKSVEHLLKQEQNVLQQLAITLKPVHKTVSTLKLTEKK